MSYYSKYMKYKYKYKHFLNKGGSKITDEMCPIIDFYEYAIGNYDNMEKHMFKNFEMNKNCNTISPLNPTHIQRTKLSSCDVIKDSLKNKFYPLLSDELSIEIFIKHLYNSYQILSTNVSLESMKMSGDVFCSRYFNHINLLIDTIYIKYSNHTNIILSQLHNDYSYIQKVSYNTNKKFIIIGDIHGGLHTFIRLLFRFHIYGIIDLTTFKINPEYVIIFLGDVIDRGNFSLEILYSILLLININNIDMINPSIIFNRGNHEEMNINKIYGFSHEIESRCMNDILFKKYNDLFKLFSSAIILNIGGNYNLWLSHGGFSINHLQNNFNQVSDNLFILTPDESIEVRWNDFDYIFNDSISDKTNNMIRGQGYILNKRQLTYFLDKHNLNFIIRGHSDCYHNSLILSNKKDETGLQCIGIAKHAQKNVQIIENKVETLDDIRQRIIIERDIISDYLKKDENKKIFGYRLKQNKLKSLEEDLQNPEKFLKKIPKKSTLNNYELMLVNGIYKTNGPIASLIADKQYYDTYNEKEKYYYNIVENIEENTTEIFPVLTLSTFATSSEKNIMGDSFTLLYFGERNNRKLEPLFNLPF
jgi:hypothetical protein